MIQPHSTTVSVIIPSYNRSWGLRRAIASVLLQDWVDLELIVVDDCSIEDMAVVLSEFPAPRILFYRQEKNVGIARNWGTGLEMARGPFVAWLMDDDQYGPGFLTTRITALLRQTDAVFAFSGYKQVCEASRYPV